jgi:hypothetical protein
VNMHGGVLCVIATERTSSDGPVVPRRASYGAGADQGVRLRSIAR